MTNPSLIETLVGSLTTPLAVLLLLTAAYSLIFCTKDAQVKNHIKAEKAARIGGWLYAALGAAVLVISLF